MRALADRIRAADSVDGAAQIEGFLDRIFLDYRVGVVFEHEAVVMGVLVAMHLSGASWIDPIAAPLRATRSAEVAAIGRLARRLAQFGVER